MTQLLLNRSFKRLVNLLPNFGRTEAVAAGLDHETLVKAEPIVTHRGTPARVGRPPRIQTMISVRPIICARNFSEQPMPNDIGKLALAGPALVYYDRVSAIR